MHDASQVQNEPVFEEAHSVVGKNGKGGKKGGNALVNEETPAVLGPAAAVPRRTSLRGPIKPTMTMAQR